MLFLGIISWIGALHFNRGVCFSDEGALFLSEGERPMGGISFDGRRVEKYHMMGGIPP